MAEQAATPSTTEPAKGSNGSKPFNVRLSESMKRAHRLKKGPWKPHGNRKPDSPMEKRDARIRAALKADPQMPYADVAKKLKVHVSRVYRVLRLDGVAPGVQGGTGSRKRGGNPVVAAKRAKILALSNQGLSGPEIVKRLRVTPGEVERARRVARKGAVATTRLSARDVAAQRSEQAIKLLAKGLHPNAIAAQMGLDVSTVYYYKAKAEGRQRASDLGRRRPIQTEHVEQPFAETVNWLKHGYQEVMAAIRKGRDPTISDCYTIVAYLKATGK